MKKNYILITISLLFCLFIYLFYRTEKTVITQFFISLVSFDAFVEMRKSVTTTIPLTDFIVYSLPEGLWVFCITLASKSLFVKIYKHEISLFFVPLIVSIGLELFQFLQLTQGRFDVLDIAVSILFWALANYAVRAKIPRQNILQPFTKRSFICLANYSIVYLAHVWK